MAANGQCHSSIAVRRASAGGRENADRATLVSIVQPCRRCTVDTTNARFRSERGNSPMIVRALSIAGSDPSGGAGIQADLKSFAAQGAYGMAVIASLTAQNTRGVRAVFSPPASFLAEQLT